MVPMGWDVRSDRGKEYVTGPVGDRLAVHITSDLHGFDGHVWLAQIRCSGDLVSTLTLTDDSCTPTSLDLTFQCPDTSVLNPGVESLLGVRAITGTLAPFTLVNAISIRPYLPTARIP